MPEQTLTFSDLKISRENLHRELGYGTAVPDGDVADLIDEVWAHAEKMARPRLLYQLIEGEKIDRTHIRIGPEEFLVGSIIAGYLDEAERFAVFVATAGEEYDAYLHELKASGDLVSEYLADALGSVIAEGAVGEIERQLTALGTTVSYPYSPGYCGWHIREQGKLFGLLPGDPCGVRLTESSLMVPIKSVSGIFGMGERLVRQGYACEICALKTCYKRNKLG